MLENVKLKVRRVWNPDFAEQHAKLIAEGKSEADAFDECLVTSCLIGWEGVEDEYSPATGAALLTDPVVGPAFRGAIIYAQGQLGSQIKASIEADEKN